ncbi:unnamed protein product [Cunninghamella blakesleeana]
MCFRVKKYFEARYEDTEFDVIIELDGNTLSVTICNGLPTYISAYYYFKMNNNTVTYIKLGGEIDANDNQTFESSVYNRSHLFYLQENKFHGLLELKSKINGLLVNEPISVKERNDCEFEPCGDDHRTFL